MVTVRGFQNSKALNDGTVLFLRDQTPLGQIYDIFGSLKQPFYTIRLRKDDIIKLRQKLEVDKTRVFHRPRDYSSYIFVPDIVTQKFTDASWENDRECPEQHLDFSDDEQERNYKLKLKSKRKLKSAMEEAMAVLAAEKAEENGDLN